VKGMKKSQGNGTSSEKKRRQCPYERFNDRHGSACAQAVCTLWPAAAVRSTIYGPEKDNPLEARAREGQACSKAWSLGLECFWARANGLVLLARARSSRMAELDSGCARPADACIGRPRAPTWPPFGEENSCEPQLAYITAAAASTRSGT